MKISVVVPAYNEERELPAALRSIRAAMDAWTRRGWTAELIVCDNNSTDRTPQIAREAGAIVVFEPINQIARARNGGAAAASGDWLVFVDADSYPTVELFQDVANAIESGRCLAGGSLVRFEHDKPSIRFAGEFWNAISRKTRWMAGSFMFCEAGAFRELGGFSMRFHAAEEIDFSRRMKRLARARGLQTVILEDHPLLTSARKADLFTLREALWLMVKATLSGGRSRRATQEWWYSGRR